MTFTSSPISVKDASAASKPMIAFNDGTNNAFANALVDNTGALVSPATAGNQTTANAALAAIQASVANIPAGGGTSTFSANGASGGNPLLTNAPAAVKTSAGSLYGLDFVNTGNAAAYVQIFDAAVGSVTLGTTAAKLTKWVPAGGSWEEKFGGEGKIGFATAITMAATAGPANNAAPAAGILANVTFK